MPKTWCIHVSNSNLIRGNTYVNKPLYISFKVAGFWGVFTLGSLTPHILSCFFCSFSSVSISSSRSLIWCAVISPVHTFCVLLLEEVELLSCSIPRVEATRKAQSFLPACQHPGECLWYPCAHQALCSQTWVLEPGIPVCTEQFLKKICSDFSVKYFQGMHISARTWELSFCVHHTYPTSVRVSRPGPFP